MTKMFRVLCSALAVSTVLFSTASALNDPDITIDYFKLASNGRYIWQAHCYAQDSSSDWTADIAANGNVFNEYNDEIGDGSSISKDEARYVIIADQLPSNAGNNAWLHLSCFSSVDFGPNLGVMHGRASETISLWQNSRATPDWSAVRQANEEAILSAFDKDFSDYTKSSMVLYANEHNCYAQIQEILQTKGGDHNMNVYESPDGSEVYMTKQDIDGITSLYHFEVTDDGLTLIDMQDKQLEISADMQEYITTCLIDVEEEQ